MCGGRLSSAYARIDDQEDQEVADNKLKEQERSGMGRRVVSLRLRGVTEEDS